MMFPIIGMVKQIGILKVLNHNQGLSVEQELIVKTAANQIGIALDREMIYAEQERIKVEVEREHMKSSMLRSISHDFRHAFDRDHGRLRADPGIRGYGFA